MKWDSTVADVLPQVRIRLLQLLPRLPQLPGTFLLSGRQLVDLVRKTADYTGQADEPVSYAVRFPRQLLELGVESGLLVQEELHRALHLLRRHRFKVHDRRALLQLPKSIIHRRWRARSSKD